MGTNCSNLLKHLKVCSHGSQCDTKKKKGTILESFVRFVHCLVCVSFYKPKEESLQESSLISDGIASGMDWLLV